MSGNDPFTILQLQKSLLGEMLFYDINKFKLPWGQSETCYSQGEKGGAKCNKYSSKRKLAFGHDTSFTLSPGI